jgi:hypothetical protein
VYCYDRVSVSRAFQRIIWNIKRQNVQVCFSEVTFGAHGTPAIFTAKPPGKVMEKTGGFALAPQTTATSSGLSDRSVEETQRPPKCARKGDARSNETIIHPRFAAWYKMG